MKKNNKNLPAGVKEIARLANVSIGTVDRVIHKREGVSDKTRTKIEAIIEKLNYQPNILAQRLALASRGTLTIAALLPNVSEETEFWQAPLDGIQQAENEIKQYGINIERFFFDQNDPASFARQIKAMGKTKYDAVLFAPTLSKESIAFIRSIEDAGTPYVLINSEIVGYNCEHYIGPDIFRSGYLAGQLVNYCIQPGQQIVIVNISGEIENNYAILRKEEGFRTYFRDKDLPNSIISLNTTETDYASSSRKLQKLFKAHDNIGAILVTNSRVSIVAQYLEKTNNADIILLGYDFVKDNVEFLKKGVIDFLICEKPKEQGYKGIMTLFQHLVYSHPVEKRYLMPIDIITRENYQFYRN